MAHLIEGYDALSGALAEHLPEWTWDPPRGGCTLWVRLPSGDARAFGQVAQRCGVNVVPGQVLSAEGGHGDRLRIPFVHEPAVIAEAVRRVAAAFDLYAGRGARMEREESPIV
jgi:DNA-binding transcriptional MocR family regulator